MIDPQKRLTQIGAVVRDRFESEKRVLSFEEYLALFSENPWRYSRDAARYLRDCFDYYGSYELPRPFGATRRFRLFDQEFRDQADGGHIPLIGHEELQNGFYRALSNFAREGRANRLVLLHGPNGSAKSTFADCIMRALEHYSMADDGALYRFRPTVWEDLSAGTLEVLTETAGVLAWAAVPDPDGNPVTGAELKAGPGAGRTIRGDKGGAPDIETASEMADAITKG